jgi:hypothetical protein
MLEAAGYPDMKGALQQTADHIGVGAMTLSRWFKGEQNPPPDNLVTIKKDDLADKFEDIAHLYLGHASRDDVLEAVSGQQAITSAAIAVDKMRLLRGLPTEIIDVAPQLTRLVELMNQFNHSLPDVINRMIMRYEKQLGDGSDTITAVQ